MGDVNSMMNRAIDIESRISDGMSTMDKMQSFNGIFSGIVIVIMILIVVFIILLTVSPKFRAKLMGMQIKATRHMVNDNKEDLTDIASVMGSVSVKSKERIIDENGDVMKEVSTKSAEINREGIEIMAQAVKKGFEKGKIFCKHCGHQIDQDSKFCNKCGKEQ